MKQITKCLLVASFSIAIIASSFASSDRQTKDIVQADTIALSHKNKKAAIQETSRYAPVYGHLPYWSKRIAYWINSNK